MGPPRHPHANLINSQLIMVMSAKADWRYLLLPPSSSSGTPLVAVVAGNASHRRPWQPRSEKASAQAHELDEGLLRRSECNNTSRRRPDAPSYARFMAAAQMMLKGCVSKPWEESEELMDWMRCGTSSDHSKTGGRTIRMLERCRSSLANRVKGRKVK